MATLVSESWGIGRELDPYGGEQDLYRRPRWNRRPGLPHGAPRPTEADLWLGGQNIVATGGGNANNPPPTNTNNVRNARNRNNASQATQNNTLQQNSAAPPTAQSQPQGRNRNRNRNRNRGAQPAAASSDTPNAQPGPSRGRGQNNQGQRSNQPNVDASNLTTDPITGEVISKRAAKRRRAKARKAASEATPAPANRQQQAINRPQPPTFGPGASVNQPIASGVTQPPGAPANARPAPSVSLVAQVGRNPILLSPQPVRTVNTATRPNITTGTTTTTTGTAQSIHRPPVNNQTGGRTSPIEDTMRRWRRLLDDTPRIVRPTNPVTGPSNTPIRPVAPVAPIAPVAAVHQAPAVPPVNRNLFGTRPRSGAIRVAPAGAPPIIPPVPPNTFGHLWDSDGEDDPPIRRFRARVVPAAPVRAPEVPNAVRRPIFATVGRTPIRTRATTACLVCLDIPEEFPQNRPTTRCTHSVTICAPCLEQHISHAVLSQGLTTIACPDPSCRQTLEYSDVIRGTKNAKACQDRYESLLLRRTLEAEPNFVWCKNASCDWGQVHASGANAPIVICQVCRARSCFTHNVPWHTGLTCTQYSVQHAHQERENTASEAYIALHAKQCPNPSCGRRIEKSDGCDHMTCRRPAGCGHEFCWICLADYGPILRDGNHHHNPTCRHYARIQRAPILDDFVRQRQHLPPPRPVPTAWARIEPIIPPRPRLPQPPPPPPPPAEQAPATGSFLGWVIGAVVAAFIAAR